MLRRCRARRTQEPSENCEQAVKNRPPKNTIGNHQEPLCDTGALDTQDMGHPEQRKPKDVQGEITRPIKYTGCSAAIKTSEPASVAAT